MYNNNPYAQGGWYNPENPLSINPAPWNLPPTSQPSVLGALPTLGSSSSDQRVLTFRMTPASPDVLNASVLGPKGQTVCVISTDYNAAPIRTIFQKADGALMGYIEWSSHGSTVTITGGVHKKPAGQWLPLSADKSYLSKHVPERPTFRMGA
ncbi:hypothetical protein CVT24_008777 [Panaeolus cyanescens]|uniref:Uncharacterized protein n=1 Tax=Panaeolus cyanescens TaxID=181874 RepID=A0A409VET2_9AGAR|nr:hypothetical protein CVT24_008777 [Panaeolus cyanescens]